MTSGYTIYGNIANRLTSGEEPEGFQILENEFQEEKRFTLVYRVVFRSPNLGTFALYYEIDNGSGVDATTGWDDDDVVPIIHVVPTPKTIIEYVEEK